MDPRSSVVDVQRRVVNSSDILAMLMNRGPLNPNQLPKRGFCIGSICLALRCSQAHTWPLRMFAAGA